MIMNLVYFEPLAPIFWHKLRVLKNCNIANVTQNANSHYFKGQIK